MMRLERTFRKLVDALANLGNARAERDHRPVLEVLDREGELSIAIDGRLSTSALTC